ncbi:DUF1797 family protein [Weissella sagaensis]|jgi:uncharacterized protein YkuJ|uniref:DUF1797 family protein n=1 Tax=Weissella sagaensis TaxID=2559928 RepID=A0ABW1RRF4_9LACO|nr:DUF1797 family protein [Weissella sagaensis]KAA8435120.1 DUF1797 family protein [Weissella paramesenteroides]MBU7568577.1 DUF1797 family protein [Weissella hellenica]KAA8439011.1 DUF1797 family protein [Weissella paramesenteroides]QDJ58430.1 DUF1797 family protein [Weissella hellenica]QEA57425.1 DUF1797 family protein [Weissella hellenica]
MPIENNLDKIVHRINAMVQDRQKTLQKRDFGIFGVSVVTVLYDSESGMFALEINQEKRKRFAFDDVDLLAIDVYEALSEFKETF